MSHPSLQSVPAVSTAPRADHGVRRTGSSPSVPPTAPVVLPQAEVWVGQAAHGTAGAALESGPLPAPTAGCPCLSALPPPGV